MNATRLEQNIEQLRDLEPLKTVEIGQKVWESGYPGTVTEVHCGKLQGMASVRLERGSVCVGISTLRAA